MKCVFPVLFAAALGLTAAACAGAAGPDPRKMQFEPVEMVSPEVRTATLDNGVRLFLLPDRGLPLVRVIAKVDSGTLHAPAQLAGMELMLARLLRDGGAGELSAEELDTQLDDNAIGLGAHASSYQYTVSLNTLTRTLPVGLARMADVLMRPRFQEDRLEVARGASMEGVRRRNDDPRRVMTRQFARHLYGLNHPRARQIERETLERVTRDDLVAFHDNHFRPGNTIIGAVGDFDPEEMITRLRETFGAWEDAPVTRPEIPPLPETGPTRVLLFEKEPDQAAIRIGQVTLNRNDPDFYNLNLAVNILGGGAFNSRLFQKVRTERGLAYAVGAGLGTSTRNLGTFSMTVYTNPEDAGEAVRVMLDEVRRMAEEPIPQQELDDARDRLLNQLVFASDTASKVLGRRMEYELEGLPLDELERIRHAVVTATPEGLRRAVQAHLDPDRMLIVAVGDAEALTTQLAPFGPVTVLPLEDSPTHPAAGE